MLTLNLLALVVVFAVVVLAAMIIRRQVPMAAAAREGEPVCLGCGTPARLLPADSFLCPICQRDVRERGVAFPSPGAFARALWYILWYSALFCVVALIATSVVIQRLPKTTYRTSTAATFFSASNEYWRLTFNAGGRRIAGGPMEGELYADLIANGGELVTLEVLSPSLRYRVISAMGQDSRPLAERKFDEAAVFQWMAAAKLDPNGQDTRARARWAYRKICELLGRELGSGIYHYQELPPPLPEAEGGGPFPGYSGASSGWTASDGMPPNYAMPVAMMIWPPLWLAGLFVIVRRCRTKTPVLLSKGVPA